MSNNKEAMLLPEEALKVLLAMGSIPSLKDIQEEARDKSRLAGRTYLAEKIIGIVLKVNGVRPIALEALVATLNRYAGSLDPQFGPWETIPINMRHAVVQLTWVDGWQDISRIYTMEERARDTLFDCLRVPAWGWR